MDVEQEAAVDVGGGQGLSGLGASGLTVFFGSIVAGIAWWWKRRENRERTDASNEADVARSRFDAEAANTASQVLELVKQQLRTQEAELADLRQRIEVQRIAASDAAAEALRLRAELQRVQDALAAEQQSRKAAENRVAELSARVALLETELSKAGREIPR